MAATAAIIGAVAAVASAGYGVYSSEQAAGEQRDQSKKAKEAMAAQAAKAPQIGKQLLPGAKANLAARGGAGAAPDLLANMIGEQAGMPSAGLDILGDIQREMGQTGYPGLGGPGTFPGSTGGGIASP